MAFNRATVFGGTGFLGRRIVERLLVDFGEVRVAARRPLNSDFERPPGTGGRAVLVTADIGDTASTVSVVESCDTVVNAVGLYIEQGDATFQSVHVDGAARLAMTASQAGVSRLIHNTGIGADPRSGFLRLRSRDDAL